MKIVITGSMGCGKSTVAAVFRRMLPEYYFFDFDQEVRNLYQDPLIQQRLLSEFGTCDKAEISDIVHTDPQQMRRLRDITDPRILQLVWTASTYHNVIFDIPLYFEFKDALNIPTDVVICVTADEAEQYARVRARSGYSDEKIAAILAKQMPQQEKVARSDFVLHNSFSSKDQLEQYVEEFVPRLMEMMEKV